MPLPATLSSFRENHHLVLDVLSFCGCSPGPGVNIDLLILRPKLGFFHRSSGTTLLVVFLDDATGRRPTSLNRFGCFGYSDPRTPRSNRSKTHTFLHCQSDQACYYGCFFLPKVKLILSIDKELSFGLDAI